MILIVGSSLVSSSDTKFNIGSLVSLIISDNFLSKRLISKNSA